jgi:hypothetical protein
MRELGGQEAQEGMVSVATAGWFIDYEVVLTEASLLGMTPHTCLVMPNLDCVNRIKRRRDADGPDIE